MYTSTQISPEDCAQRPFVPQPRLEILEWGKFCDRPDGRTCTREEEHGILGASAGFPPELQNFCDPRYLGISKGQFEEEREQLFEHVKYGTAFRPVILPGRCYSVFYRVGVRPEDPDVPLSRNYTLARYLAGAPGLDLSPMAIFLTMLPLSGITTQQASALQGISLTVNANGAASPEPFLKPAIIYLLSGVPVHIRATEEDFFRLVDQLWRALPAALRPLLSAGWNVSSSVVKEVAVCCSAFVADTSALYENGRWRPPLTSSGSDGELLPGRLYAARLFPASSNEFEKLAESILHNAQLRPASIALPLGELPAFQDPAVRIRFENAGMDLLEDVALRQLRAWMESGSPALEGRLTAIVRSLQEKPGLIELIHRGLADSSRWERADRLAWAYLQTGKALYENEADAPEAGRYRGALLQAIFIRQSRETLQALLDSSRCGEAGLLPPEIIEKLHAVLTAENISLHFELLQESGAAAVYLPWARAHVIELALAFARDPALARRGTELLQGICRATASVPPALESLAALLSGYAVTQPHRDALRRLPEPGLSQLGYALGNMWASPAEWGLDRALLLDWCAGMPTQIFSNSVLAFATGGTITAERLTAMVKSGLDTIPHSLWPKLSRAALLDFKKLRLDIEKDMPVWSRLIGMWPRAIAIALLGKDIALPPQEHFVSLPQSDFSPDAEFIQQLIEEWFLDISPERQRLLGDAAAMLWKWAGSLNTPKHSEFFAVDICRCLWEKRFVDAELAESAIDQVNLAIALVRVSGHQEELAGDALRLWGSALRAWQIRLLLELFPAARFQPTTAQLAALLPCRSWLRTHLHFHNSQERQDSFAIATCDFHSINFPGSGNKQWRPEWADTALAGIYRGAPVPQLALGQAFKSFASTSEGQARICAKYLAALAAKEGFPSAVSQVLWQYLLPAAKDARLTRDEFIKIVSSVHEPEQRIIHVAFDPEKPFERRIDGIILMADYMIPLLWVIIQAGYAKRVREFALDFYEPGREKM